MNKIADAPPVPATLIDAIRYFSDPDRALAFMVELRWPNGVTCPTCGGQSVSFVKTRRVWTCRGQHPRKQFSVKIGTIFEDSPIGLDKWFAAMWLIGNAKNGISSYEIARGIHVTQKTAWFMLHRIRLAMQRGTFDKLAGEVEADETFIGGKARFMHAHKRAAKITGTGGKDKSAVMGLLERHGPDGHSRVRVKHVANTRRSRWRRKSGRTSSLVLTSTPMRSSPMMGCPTPTLTRSSTTPKPMFEGTLILTGWKTSGLCSARDQGNLCFRRAVPPVPVPGRRGVPI